MACTATLNGLYPGHLGNFQLLPRGRFGLAHDRLGAVGWKWGTESNFIFLDTHNLRHLHKHFFRVHMLLKIIY